MPQKHRIEIVYCPRCKWLARAAWMAQELLTTFEGDLAEVALRPSEIGGAFDILLNSERLFSRADSGDFPQPKAIKQLVRNSIDPDRDLGHVDSP